MLQYYRCGLNDRYVPDEKFAQVWEESQQTLLDYLTTHFNNRPNILDDGMLIDNCTTSIMMVAASMNKPQDENIVKDMLKVICKRLRRTHQEMAIQSQQDDEEVSEEEEEETPEEKKTQEKLENSRAITRTQQADHLRDFQTDEGMEF